MEYMIIYTIELTRGKDGFLEILCRIFHEANDARFLDIKSGSTIRDKRYGMYPSDRDLFELSLEITEKWINICIGDIGI